MSDNTIDNPGIDSKGIQTQAIHAGEKPDVNTGASAPNLVMSSTFVVDEEVSFSANNLTEETPFVYTRWSNPTTQQLEQKLAVLEKAKSCVAFASGRDKRTNVEKGIRQNLVTIENEDLPAKLSDEKSNRSIPRLGDGYRII